MDPVRIAVIGLGKIARDQHLPAIAADPTFHLAATVGPDGDGVDGVPHFASIDALSADGPAIDAVALCTPPQVRYGLAARALAKRLHVFLEKPPGATLGEVAALELQAADAGVTLFAGWHSRFAAGVAPARAWLAERRIDRVEIVWREDVRVWHPGQAWIWQPGGLGVFDPGINALSILTRILPRPFFLTGAELSFPSNCAAPIAADLTFSDVTGLPIRAEFDFRQTGPQTWDISVDTDAGQLKLSSGGRRLVHDGRTLVDEKKAEYRKIYRRFVELIANRESDVDLSPLVHVADAFMLGRRRDVEPFIED